MTQRRRVEPRTNEAWSAQTIAALTRRARQEFARSGYAGTSVEAIAAEVGLTKGAIYYHFGSKAGLFEVVLRDAQRDIVQRIEQRASAVADPARSVIAGCEAFVDVALDDELRQIALVDGPAVLGWSKWRAIDGEHGLGSLKAGLRACEKGKALGPLDLDALAHLISGALNEAVFLVVDSDDRRAAHARLKPTLRAFLTALIAIYD